MIRLHKTNVGADKPEARKDALKQNSDYRQFIENLKSVSYFRDNLEGSQAWNELEDKAVDAFLEARREEYAVIDASVVSGILTLIYVVTQAGLHSLRSWTSLYQKLAMPLLSLIFLQTWTTG